MRDPDVKKTDRPEHASKTELRRGRIRPGTPEDPETKTREDRPELEQLLFGELRPDEQQR